MNPTRKRAYHERFSAEAFRSVLEKLLNLAMELERGEFLGADPYERTTRRRDHANGQGQNGVGRLKLPQVRHLSFYPSPMPVGEGLKAGYVRERGLHA